MIFGIGGALTEHAHIDPRDGHFVGRSLAHLHLPSHADIPDLEVLMLGEPLQELGPLGAKGIGELGLSGIGGAIASAVAHATGVRVRSFPITPDRLVSAWEADP